MNKKLIAPLVSAALFIVMPAIAMADVSVEGLACKVQGIVVIAFGVAAVVYFLWYGIMFLMARGEAGKISEARLGVLWGVVGVVVGVLALTIISTVTDFFNVGGAWFVC